ncbi:MAG: sel1 repeat family protein [Terrimicrobiaceae bacterium]|nr:sel1 repeat family protein [Terrimicrobiaceae bacterium]
MRILPFAPALLAALISAVLSAAEPASPASSLSIAQLEEKASEGDAAAMYELGRRLYRGLGTEKNLERSVELIRQSATLGHPEAMDGLGFLYLNGDGIEKSEERALGCFRKSAEAGHPRGMLNYGLLLRQGKSIALDNEESLKWIHKAADTGLVDANAALGRIYFSGDKLQDRKLEESVEFVRRAAEAGDPACQNIMGVICRTGVGKKSVGRAPEQAEGWFRKAAEQGDRKGMSNLASEIGFAPNNPRRKEAIKWLMIARNLKEPNAERMFEQLGHTFSEEEMREGIAAASAHSVKAMVIEAGKAPAAN